MQIIKPVSADVLQHNHETLSQCGRELCESAAKAIVVIGATERDQVHVKGLNGFPPEHLAEILEMCARELRTKKTINLHT
jgi:hypothetical protein